MMFGASGANAAIYHASQRHGYAAAFTGSAGVKLKRLVVGV